MASDPSAAAPPANARAPLDLGSGELAKTAEGLGAAAHYGDPEAEYRLARSGCGLLDRLWVEHLEVAGEDRGRFLNGLTTGDARALEAGQGLFVFFTSAQGRILAEARVAALADRLLLELPVGCADPIRQHMSRYIVADRVELAPRPDLRALVLLGPESWRVAAQLLAEDSAPGGAPAGRWQARRAEWQGTELVLAREERLGAPAITVHVAESAAAAVAAELRRPVDGVAAEPVGFAAAEALRIEAGMARFGPDFDAERFPQEVGETDALDFEKGCYLGQEVVARIHYRGKVNHRLCGLRLDEGELPPPGSPVELGGEGVGRSGSAAWSPGLQANVALAVLHRKAERGVAVTVAGRRAEVVDLPFVTP